MFPVRNFYWGIAMSRFHIPASAPEETRGDIAYVTGRAREDAGDPDGAMSAYASVARSSRFWAQATYLRGLILVERRRFKEGEELFCKIADPGRKDRTSATFGDEHYFAIRDLARLALGRVAHEQTLGREPGGDEQRLRDALELPPARSDAHQLSGVSGHVALQVRHEFQRNRMHL